MRIGCTLPTDQIPQQLDEWRSLRASATTIEAIPGGRRLSFPIERAETVLDLARREQGCCSFLRLITREAGGRIVLDITSDDADAVIDLIAGPPTTGTTAETTPT